MPPDTGCASVNTPSAEADLSRTSTSWMPLPCVAAASAAPPMDRWMAVGALPRAVRSTTSMSA